VRISDVTEEVAKDAGLKEVAGIQVQSLTDGGAAQDSGIREGDIIQKIGEASVKNVPQLQEQVSRYRPGDKVKVTVWRDSKAQMVDVVLRNRSGKPQLEDFSKASTSAGGSIQSLGATFGEPATEDISKLRITGGAKVTDLQPGKFKSIGMQKGFIVTKIDGMTINNPEDLKTALEGKEGKYVEIKGYYSNGMEAMYGFRL
jgi:S1-C subfamily serine protease